MLSSYRGPQECSCKSEKGKEVREAQERKLKKTIHCKVFAGLRRSLGFILVRNDLRSNYGRCYGEAEHTENSKQSKEDGWYMECTGGSAGG